MSYNINMGINNNFNQINNYSNINENILNNQYEEKIYDDRNKPGPKINVVFRNNQGKKITLILNQNRTVEEMLTIYLKTIKKPELIGQKSNPRFIYNAENLYFGDKRLIDGYILHNSFVNVI